MSAPSPVLYHPIGVLYTPFIDPAGMPIQPSGASGVYGTAEIYPEYAAGLHDLAGFSHIILLYHFHHAPAPRLTVIPFLDTAARGIFATRAPARPNPIGLSVVRLLRCEGATLFLEAVDMLDGTPLLDIKPYVPAFDYCAAESSGWLEAVQRHVEECRADKRFGDP